MNRLIAFFADALEKWLQQRAEKKDPSPVLVEKLKDAEAELHERVAAKVQAAEPKLPDFVAKAEAVERVRLISDVYRPELLFDDAEFYGEEVWFSVQGFFKERECFLATWKDPLSGKWAADIIEEACKRYGCDQRIILIALQREQQAIRFNGKPRKDPMPERKMNRILGYGCLEGKTSDDHGTDLEKYYGFTKQIENAARRYVALGKEWVEGKSLNLDFGKTPITPLNGPTWAMYRYNPQTLGGKTSYLIGKSYFGM